MIQVIHRAFDILEYVANDPERPKPLGAIARDLSLNAATTANIIKTLVTRGYVEKLELQKGYLPGKKMHSLGSNAIYKQDLIEASDEEVLKLSRKLQENVLIAILKGDTRIVVHHHIYKQMVQATTQEEKKAYDSSTGRLMIALQSDEFQTKFILKHGLPTANVWYEASTQKKFNACVKKIREDGYAVIECTDQILGIAAPIYKKDVLIAALSVYIPEFRFDESKREKIVGATIKSAQNISAKLSV